MSSSSLSLESRAPTVVAAAAAAAAAVATTAASDDMESDERPYVCDLCSCAYKHASSLLNHKLTHKTGDFRWAPYRCDVNDPRFSVTSVKMSFVPPVSI